MANKPSTTDVSANAQYLSSTFNGNFAILEDAIEGCLGRGGTSESPNSMEGDLDMDLYKVQNLGTPSADNDAVRLVDLSDSDATGAASAQLRIDVSPKDTVADMKTTDLTQGTYIKTKGFYAKGDGGAATYLIKTSANYGATPDEYGDHTMSNGNVAVLQYEGPVNIKWFGAKDSEISGNESFDSFNHIQAAVDTGRSVFIPKGLYRCSGTITFPTTDSGVTLLGEDSIKSRLLKTATGVLIESNSPYFHIEKISVYGEKVDPLFWTTGYQGIKTNGNLTLFQVNIRHLDEAIIWNGGYYHKYINCQFAFINTIAPSINGNNYTLIGCKLSSFNDGFQISAGNGNFAIKDSAIEKWYGSAVKHTSGSVSSILLENNYIENYPALDETAGGITGLYDAAFITVLTGGNISFINNNIQTKGIRRAVYCTGATPSYPHNITAIGNTWFTSSTADNDLEHAYYIAGDVNKVFIRDATHFPTEAGHTKSYAKSFLNSTAITDLLDVYDSFTEEAIVESWKDITLLNGWTNDGGAGEADLQYYKDPFGTVHVRGFIDGGSSTSVVVGTLPAGYRPEKYERVSSATTAGLVVVMRTLTNGDIRVESPATPINVMVNFTFRAYQ